MKKSLSVWHMVLFCVLSMTTLPAQAGVFGLYHFVTQGNFSLGAEAELTLTHGAGVAGNFKYTHGLSELTNLTGIIGTGGGPRGFRAGGALTFDFFPDLEKQPGIGISVQGLYYRLTDFGQVEITAIPYIHKSFVSAGHEIEPFFAIPLGMAFANGQYNTLSTIVIGSMFKGSTSVRFTLELGVAISNTETYASGGIVYYYP